MSSKKYVVIPAGGRGVRLGSELPKQFLEIKNKPIIAYTVEKFLMEPEFDKIIVLTPEKWIDHTQGILEKYIGKNEKINSKAEMIAVNPKAFKNDLRYNLSKVNK